MTRAFICVLVLLTACSSTDDGTEASASAVIDDDAVAPDTTDASDTTDAGSSSTTTAVESSTTTAVETTTTAAPVPLIDACVTNRVPEIGSQNGVVRSGGHEYDVLWTVPGSYDTEPVALVLDFHGIGSNGPEQNAFGGFGAMAEAEGFVAVEPTGQHTIEDARKSWELPQFDTDERDDVAFVVDLIDFMAAQVCVDQQRIYATGMSNGGLFTSVLVCDLSERIAAAVSVAGVTHPETCSPSRAVPFMAFHGTDDTVVPYGGGGESTLSGSEGSGDFFEQVMPDEMAEFAADFACADFADSVISAEVSLRSWSGCRDDVDVIFYTIEGGGHTWPGSGLSRAFESGLGYTTLDVNATEVAWEFFERNPLPG